MDSETAAEVLATVSSTASLGENAKEQVEGRPKSNRRFIMVAAACAGIVVAGTLYLVVPRKVLIKTIPTGARVQVDQQTCSTPCTLKLRAGEHSLRAASDGYSATQRTFSVPWFGVNQPTIALEPISTLASPSIQTQPANSNPEVLIRTSVPGASIFVDGSPSAVGRTDQSGQFKFPMTVGSHYIRVEKAGFENSSIQTITAKSNEVAVVRFDLKPSSGTQPQVTTAPTDQVTERPKVNTVPQTSTPPPVPVLDTFLVVEAPEGAEIHIDQQFVGHSTGGMLKCKVQPGQKTVDVYLAGFQPWSRSVIVDLGAHPTVTAQLVPVQKSSPPPIAPAPATTGISADDRMQIQQLLDRYATGYTDRNSKLIQDAWPSVHPDQIKKIRDFLKNFKSVKMSLRMVNAVPAGNRVTVDCTQTLSYELNGKEEKSVSQLTLYVVKRESGWLIDFIPNS